MTTDRVDRGPCWILGPAPEQTQQMSGEASRGLTFDSFVLAICGIDVDLAAQAGCTVDLSLTFRNWLVPGMNSSRNGV